MGGILGTGNSNLVGTGGAAYGYGDDLQCCDGVVDPISLLTAIGAIVAVSLFLRQAVIDFDIKAARRRWSLDFATIVKSGKNASHSIFSMSAKR